MVRSELETKSRMNENANGQCAQIWLLLYTVLFWLTGLVLIFLSLWILLDPRRNYVLDLVDFSEDDPLLRGATYLALTTGSVTLIIGFIGCCGAIKKSLCMIVTFVICLLVLFFADVTIASLALFYRNKFIAGGFDQKLQSLIRENYGAGSSIGRNAKITSLIDRLQFNEQCCGSMDYKDWNRSRWRASYRTDVELLQLQARFDFDAVPKTCCVQLSGATPMNPVARSLARCQQPQANKSWRHQTGCHEKLLDWLTVQTVIFVSVGLSFAAFQLIGICIALSLSRHVHGFYYITV